VHSGWIVGNPDLGIISGLLVIRPESGPDLVAEVASATPVFVVRRNFLAFFAVSPARPLH
jgi:hypothetical protein